jgi:hypothetical protein
MNPYNRLLVAATQYDPLSTDYFRIVRAVNNYQYLTERWYAAPESRNQIERLLQEAGRWCEAIQYAITNRLEIPAWDEVQHR